MRAFFFLLGNVSLQAMVLAGLVLVLQWGLRKRMPARWRFALWLLVFVRLSGVSLPESRFSVFNWVPVMPAQVAPTHVASGGHVVIDPEIAGPAIVESVVAPTPKAISWWSVIGAVYFAGMAVVGVRMGMAMWGLRRIVGKAVRVTDVGQLNLLRQAERTGGVRRELLLMRTEGLASPALVGLWRPRLLVPGHLLEGLSGEELRFVFLHECGHWRRRDLVINYWLAVLSAVHWFNPMWWMLLPRIRADRELACDEMVMMHTGEPLVYGETLLKLVESAGRFSGSPGAVGILETRTFFKRRIQMIAAFKRTPKWLGVTAAGLLVMVAAGTLTTAVTKAADEVVKKVEAAGGTASVSPESDVLRKMNARRLAEAEAQKAAGARGSAAPTSNEVEQMQVLARLEELDKQRMVAGKTTGPEVLAELDAKTRALQSEMAALQAKERGVASGDSDAESAVNVAVLRKLDEKIPEISADPLSFESFTNDLQNTMKCNVLVKWKVLASVGIEKNTPFTMHLVNVPVHKALKMVLDDVGEGKLGYVVDEGVLTISTKDDLDSSVERVMRVYNVRDLLELPVPTAVDSHGSATQPASETSNLISVIEANASPNSWVQNGGAVSSVSEFKGLLTITTTPAIHRQIATVLENLRTADKNEQH